MREGERVGDRFLLVRRMPGGNQHSEVWLARDERLGREVVLKRGDQLSGEARAMARSNHPHVIRLYEVVSVGEHDWFVMEYAPDGSLAGKPGMSPARAARVGAQIAGALAALHAAGIVHCDVKPGNIVIAEDGTAKLTDFGAAYRIDETITPQTAVSYTVRYAAPEVVGGNPEPASDVYSLAVTLHDLVAGAPAAPETDTGVTPMRTDPVSPNADVGPLRKVLSAMRHRAPGERPDAAAARRMLADVAGHRARRRGVLVTLAAAAVVVLLVGAAMMVNLPPLFDDEPAAAGPAAPVFGDVRTADPCALTDEASFGRFGDTYLDRDYGNFERCDVLVTMADGVEADVEVAFDGRPPPEQAAVTMRGEVGIVAFPLEDGDCDRAVLPPKGNSDGIVWVSVDADGPAPLCELADVAAELAAERVGAGPLPRRSPPLPEDSLVWRNACELLDPERLAVVPSVDAEDPDAGFGNWSCDWGSTSDEEYVYLSLAFDRGSPPTADDGQQTRIAGRDATVQPESDGEQTCAILVEYREYSDQDGDPAVEMLRLDIGAEHPTDQLCAMISDLAESAATAL